MAWDWVARAASTGHARVYAHPSAPTNKAASELSDDSVDAALGLQRHLSHLLNCIDLAAVAMAPGMDASITSRAKAAHVLKLVSCGDSWLLALPAQVGHGLRQRAENGALLARSKGGHEAGYNLVRHISVNGPEQRVGQGRACLLGPQDGLTHGSPRGCWR